MDTLTLPQAVFTGQSAIIDTHSHYNLEPFFKDWRSHWQRAQDAGVVATVIPGVDAASSQRSVEIARQDERLWSLVGVHPSEAGQADFDLAQLTVIEELMADPNVLGIGEIGLDYYWLDDTDQASRQRQQVALREQLKLAQKHGGWVCLHVRDKQAPEAPTQNNAYWDTWQIVQEFDWGEQSQQFILHCVSGPVAYVRRFIDFGAYTGFDGNLTYPKAEDIRALWRLTPPEKRLLETDAPYLPPQPYRGQTCEPWMIQETAEYAREGLL